MEFDLSGKIAVITGASSGMGWAIALAYAEHGADLVVTARSKAKLDALVQEITALGRRAFPVVADLLEPAQAAIPVEAAIKEFGRVDILVNNAGGASVYVEGGTAPLLTTTLQSAEELFRLNTFAPMIAAQAAAKDMIKRGSGVIINVTSASGHNPGPEVQAYGGAKAALHMMSVAWTKELGPHGIRVNEIIPGAVETNNLANRIATPEGRAIMEGISALGRLGRPDHIAAAALYLASNEADWVSGAALRVSGGLF